MQVLAEESCPPKPSKSLQETLIHRSSHSHIFPLVCLSDEATFAEYSAPCGKVSRVLRDQLWKGVSFPSTLIVVRKELENGLIKAYNLIVHFDFQNA